MNDNSVSVDEVIAYVERTGIRLLPAEWVDTLIEGVKRTRAMAKVEEAVREEREAIVRKLRRSTDEYKDFASSEASTRCDRAVATALEFEASRIERGEHRSK